jgi:hypothetical protein
MEVSSMPPKRQQLNIRLPEEGRELLGLLAERMRAELGITVSQSDVVLAGLNELRKKYLADGAPPATAAKRRKA